MNHAKANKRAGFTLVEVLAAAALAAVAISASMAALAKLQAGEGRARQREQLINLTVEKYDEVISTYDLTQTSSLTGDFTDRNDNDHTWSANLQALSSSGTNSNSVVNTGASASTASTTVDQLSVTVKSNKDETQTYTVTGLIYVPPTNTTGTSSGTTPRAGVGGRAG